LPRFSRFKTKAGKKYFFSFDTNKYAVVVGISFVNFIQAMNCFLIPTAIEVINIWPTMSARQ